MVVGSTTPQPSHVKRQIIIRDACGASGDLCASRSPLGTCDECQRLQQVIAHLLDDNALPRARGMHDLAVAQVERRVVDVAEVSTPCSLADHVIGVLWILL